MEALHDHAVINGNSKGWHKTSAAMSVYVILFIALVNADGLDYHFHSHETIKIIGYGLLIRWIALDNLLNVLRGKGLFYVGETAWMDRQAHLIEKKTKGIINCEFLMLTLKVGFLLLLILY